MDLSSLNINGPAIAVNIVGFLLLLWIANSLVFKPIGKVIQERQDEFTGTYDKIDADRALMEATRADYEKRLAEIEEQRRETVQRSINEAKQASEQILHDARANAQTLATRAEQEIAREREQAMIALRTEVVDIVLGATTKLIGDSLDTNRQRKLVDDFIASSGTLSVPSAAATTTTVAEA